jgi:hypothetical protein
VRDVSQVRLLTARSPSRMAVPQRRTTPPGEEAARPGERSRPVGEGQSRDRRGEQRGAHEHSPVRPRGCRLQHHRSLRGWHALLWLVIIRCRPGCRLPAVAPICAGPTM